MNIENGSLPKCAKKVYYKNGIFTTTHKNAQTVGFTINPILKRYQTRDIKIARRLATSFDESAQNVCQPISLVPDKVRKPYGPIVPMCKQLRPHQIRGFEFALSRNHCLLAFEQRLGKTPIAIVLINKIMWEHRTDLGKMKPILIIAPAHLVEHWQNELKDWLTFGTACVAVLSDSKGKIKVKNRRHKSHIYILPASFTSRPNSVEGLRLIRYSLCILDEPQRYADPNSISTKVVYGENPITVEGRGLVHCADKVLLLSGTPVKSSSMDLWPAIQALCHNLFNFCTREEFGKKFCQAVKKEFYTPRGLTYRYSFKGFKNVELLNKILSGNFMLRETFKSNFKTKDPVQTLVMLDNEYRQTKELISLEKKVLSNKNLKQLMRSENTQLVSKYRKMLSYYKIPASVHYIANKIEEGERIIAFGIHTETILEVAHRLKKYNSYSIYGKIDRPSRRMIRDKFQSGECKVIVANINCVEGLDFDRGDRVIFFESSWTHAANAQAFFRIQSLSKNEAIQVEHLVVEDSIDEYVMRTVLNKQINFNKLINNERSL